MFEYRESVPADVPAMALIRAAEWGAKEDWVRRIHGYMAGEVFPQKALAPRAFFSALRQAELVGFIAGHLTRRFGCAGELEWINVDAACRGSEVASKLLALLAQWFVQHGALRICVNVTSDNVVARRFYSRHGARELKPGWMVWDDISAVLTPE
ncbi:MAG: GNAT family N-acetyltransferase [Acidobacteria bacterium]|nr:GNAT family N-acetyltransferase [Acidobacteriota bacterium]